MPGIRTYVGIILLLYTTAKKTYIFNEYYSDNSQGAQVKDFLS